MSIGPIAVLTVCPMNILQVARSRGTRRTIELRHPAAVVYQPEAEFASSWKDSQRCSGIQSPDYVFGYVPFFDVSTRGMVRRTQFIPKGQDSHGACGPWIITKDEIPDPHNVVVKSWTSGEPRQNYNTKYMAHKIPDQIAWLTKFLRLNPGDIVATGTFHEGLRPMNPGDTIEIEFENMGGRSLVAATVPQGCGLAAGTHQPQPPEGGGCTGFKA
jgi:2-keto-4-pentenoate hydratase/2-oxohepta-3-ene-1,7-dioic acid hydratase in catechol pathway